MRKLLYLSIALTAILASSCLTDSLLEGADSQEPTSNLSKTRAIPTPEFDWENNDWMPTPPGQSRIPSPWGGPGGIASTYSMEIVNDRYKSDGWELIYNSFDANAPSPLVNPYFALYNKYRGTIRFYLYLTTQFITPSSYVQDGLVINSSYSTSLLNFLGNEIIDITNNNTSRYDQIQPAPLAGGSPLASNKWYMIQYELAYDPNLTTIPSKEIQLLWYLEYCNVQTIALGGKAVGTINGTIGASGTSGVLSKFKKAGEVAGTGVLAGIGTKFITDNEKDANTGENWLGMNESIFKSISSGLKSALSGSISSLPGALFKGLSAIFGSKGTQPIPVNLQSISEITLEGNISEKGSFPTSPFIFNIPGTNNSSDAIFYVPLYNKSIGVINLKSKPKIKTRCEILCYPEEDPYDGSIHPAWNYDMIYPNPIDYSDYLIINPEVEKIANVVIKQQDLVCLHPKSLGVTTFNPTRLGVGTIYSGYGDKGNVTYPKLAVRFTIEVRPKNGDSISTIIKTFMLDEEREEVEL